MKIGLVLGAGGVTGGAWLTGALHAVAEETGWDPGSADRIVGTSAGSLIGALVAAGVPPWFMVAHSAGETFEGLQGADGRPVGEASRSGGAVFKLHRGLPALGPGSLRLALTTVRNPRAHTPLAVVAGWLPRGLVSTESLKHVVRRAVPSGWVEHDGFWAVACHYASGRRTPFGHEDAPRAQLPDAVAASCAIPGFYRPVEIGGSRYVDGGVCSPSNLDLLADQGLDLVICLNPTSSRELGSGGGAAARLADSARRLNGRRLGREAKQVREGGARVVLIQPTGADLAVMGSNPMRTRDRERIIDTAIESTTRQLGQKAVAGELGDLPPGDPHKVRRPPGPPAEWPELVPALRRRRVA